MGPGFPDTINDVLLAIAGRLGDRRALGAPGVGFVDFDGLLDQVDATGAELRGHGIGRKDVVALVLPDGPELASLFLGTAAAAICAPLNPAFKEPEFEFYLSDLRPALIVVAAEAQSTIEPVARRIGIPVAFLTSVDGPGRYELKIAATRAPSGDPVDAAPNDVALILHTSGTTARPKMVPLRQANLIASAHNVAQALELSPTDCCLNIMPLFHIHGLVAAVLGSITAGSSVVCTPGFDATRFHGWIDEVQPTWYSAVPTMHQAILDRLHQPKRKTSLRLIRSSSSALPPVVMARLEEAFEVPVLEAYGMTEAAHQIASNPLPPQVRKPGSVGVAAGAEIEVLDDDGTPLGPDQVGEVAIRGSNVFSGYAGLETHTNDNEAWFHTGDLGRLDAEGYLFLSGRIKEMINRGGETIAPREIDEALVAHPAVHQALAFSVPDPRLGEQVAAAVVLEPQTAVTEIELREFVAQRLSPAKVPRRIVFCDEIPKGPTGKLARIGLAQKLGLADLDGVSEPRLSGVAPRTAVEALLAGFWREVLERDDIGVLDRFLDVGGDSLLAVRLLARIRDALGLEPSMIEFFDRATIAGQSELIEDLLLVDAG